MLQKFITEVENYFVFRCFIFETMQLDEALKENHSLKNFTHAFIIKIKDKNAFFPNMDIADVHVYGIYSKLANKAMAQISTRKNMKKYSWNFYRNSNKNAIVFLCSEIV